MTTLRSPAQVCAVPTTLAEPCPVVSRPTKTTGRPSPREAMAYQASATTVTRAHLPAPCDLPHLHPSALADFSALAIPSLADWHYHAQPCHACATVQFFAGLRIPGRLSIDLSAPHRSAPVSPAPIDLPRRSPPCPPRTDLSSPAIPCPAQAFRLVPSGRTSPSPRDPAHQHAPGRSTATRQHLSRRPSSARRAYHDRYRANSYLADKLFRACSGHRSPSPADCACHAVPSLRQSTNPATLTRPWPCRHAAACPPDPGRLAIAAQGITGPTRRAVASRATSMSSRHAVSLGATRSQAKRLATAYRSTAHHSDHPCQDRTRPTGPHRLVSTGQPLTQRLSHPIRVSP